MQELLYTSAQRGLKPGSRGFCTVLSTQRMVAPLAEALEGLSGYRLIFPSGDPHAANNPVVFSHLKLQSAGKPWNVLSRISDYGLDYSQRTNKLAHHLVLGPHELPVAGPASLLRKPGVMRPSWDGEAKIVPPKPMNVQPVAPSGICQAWKDMTGDAGWAGVVAESFLKDPNQLVILLFEPGQDLLPLIDETISLLPAERRWEVTFSTYFTGTAQGISCNWRGIIRGSKEANDSLRFVNALRIDLTADRLPPARGGELVAAARSGVRKTANAVPPPFPVTHSDDAIVLPLSSGNSSIPPKLVSQHADSSIAPPRLSRSLFKMGFGRRRTSSDDEGSRFSKIRWILLPLILLVCGFFAWSIHARFYPTLTATSRPEKTNEDSNVRSSQAPPKPKAPAATPSETLDKSNVTSPSKGNDATDSSDSVVLADSPDPLMKVEVEPSTTELENPNDTDNDLTTSSTVSPEIIIDELKPVWVTIPLFDETKLVASINQPETVDISLPQTVDAIHLSEIQLLLPIAQFSKIETSKVDEVLHFKDSQGQEFARFSLSHEKKSLELEFTITREIQAVEILRFCVLRIEHPASLLLCRFSQMIPVNKSFVNGEIEFHSSSMNDAYELGLDIECDRFELTTAEPLIHRIELKKHAASKVQLFSASDVAENVQVAKTYLQKQTNISLTPAKKEGYFEITLKVHPLTDADFVKNINEITAILTTQFRMADKKTRDMMTTLFGVKPGVEIISISNVKNGLSKWKQGEDKGEYEENVRSNIEMAFMLYDKMNHELELAPQNAERLNKAGLDASFSITVRSGDKQDKLEILRFSSTLSDKQNSQ